MNLRNLQLACSTSEILVVKGRGQMLVLVQKMRRNTLIIVVIETKI